MDLNAWKYQTAIDQLGHNAKVADHGAPMVDLLIETARDVAPLGVHPAFVDIAAHELLLRGAGQRLLEDAHLEHNRLDALLNEAVAADYLDRRRQEIITAVLIAA